MENRKYTIVMISDHPLASSGVGTQTKYIIQKMLDSGKFRIISLAGMKEVRDQRLQKIKEWGDDVVIIPTEGYGNPEILRQIIAAESPDALWLMTDPRFYEWLFAMEHEVRKSMPILYNAIWDNPPAPKYNIPHYSSCDFIGCISKVTKQVVDELGFGDRSEYIPHGVPADDFKILHNKTERELKIEYFGVDHKDSFVLFYNSRNALRKRTGNVIMAFKEFRDSLPEEERDKVLLFMHTPPDDPEGQDLHVIRRDFDLRGSLKFSDKKVPPHIMNEFYNLSQVTVSMSSEEGFGLSVLESLMTGTPVICTKTGGMQDQVIDPDTGEEFGFCMEAQARSLIGSQRTPYLWQHHLDPSAVAEKFKVLYDEWVADPIGYKEKFAGTRARESMIRRFNLDTITERWVEKFEEEILKFESKQNKQRTFDTLTI